MIVRSRFSAVMQSAKCSLRLLVITATLVVLAANFAHAQEAPLSPPKAPFGVSAGSPPAPASAIQRYVDRAWSLLLFEQHRLTEDMTGAVRNIKSTTSIASATSALAFASFVYGILHAAGPGHGKAVISTYMLADRETLKRGIFLAFLSSFIQALSAIALVGGLYLVTRATGLQTRAAEAWLETVSWGCVAVLGAWLLLKQLLPLFKLRDNRTQGIEEKTLDATPHHHAHRDADAVHGHHNCSCANHKAAHVHDAHCGHDHIANPRDLKGELSWRKAFALALSVGIRPCTGALLVIIFASSQGLIWAGILATFAMALGTAITVSALASLSVGSRNLAIVIAGQESRSGQLIARVASITSSALVFVLGAAFFVDSFHNQRPF